MSESADGLIEPLARQNSGSLVKSAPNAANAGCGGGNAPAATVSVASVVFGKARLASSAHVFGCIAAAAGCVPAPGPCFAPSQAASAAAADTMNTIAPLRMIRSPQISSRLPNLVSHRIHRDVHAEA